MHKQQPSARRTATRRGYAGFEPAPIPARAWTALAGTPIIAAVDRVWCRDAALPSRRKS